MNLPRARIELSLDAWMEKVGVKGKAIGWPMVVDNVDSELVVAQRS